MKISKYVDDYNKKHNNNIKINKLNLNNNTKKDFLNPSKQ